MNDTTRIRKVEFKVKLDRQQAQVFEHHSDKLRFIWNCGLACIEWREWFEKWQQVLESPELSGYEPEPVPMRWSGTPDKRKTVYGLCCDRVAFKPWKEGDAIAAGEWVEKGNGKNWLAYPSKPQQVREHWTEEPRLALLMKNPYMALRTMFAKKNWDIETPTGAIVHSLNTAWVAGECKALGDAWSSYKSGVRKRPRFKKRHERSNLINPSSKQTKITGDRLSLPGLGKVTVKGLAKRWGNKPACPIALIRTGNTFYLQLTGEVPVSKPRHNGVTIGIDPGSVSVSTDDRGNTIKPPRYGKKTLRRMKRLQSSMNRKIRLNSVRVYDSETPGKFYLKPSAKWTRKNFNKLKRKLQSLRDTETRQRRAFNHYHSTRLVQSADTIVLEDFGVRNLTKSVKKGESGQKNGRKRKKGLTKNLLDNAIGQLFGMIEQKASDAGKLVVRVNPYRTSQTCHKCGFSSELNRPKKRNPARNFTCQKCGHFDAGGDTNAGSNIRKMGLLGVVKLTFDEHENGEWWCSVPGWTEPVDTQHSKAVNLVKQKRKKSS